MLWLALHLPRLPLDIFRRSTEDTTPGTDANVQIPFAVSSNGSRPVVLLPDATARGQGVRAGMSLSAAYALAPELRVRARDTALEAETLETLALWAEQFTPSLSLEFPDSLLLEIGGCLRLFDGLDALLDRVRQGLHDLGFDALLASAPTPSGALLLARSGLELQVPDEETLRRRIGQLPVESLDASPRIVDALRRLGLRTLHECLQLPRDGLARRFGPELVDHLDRATGRMPDPRKPFVPPPDFTSRLVLPVPVPHVEQVLFGAKRLVTELAGFLLGRGAGVTRFTCSLEHEEMPATHVDIELSMPSRDPSHLGLLLREHLSRRQLPAPVEAIGLRCTETMQLAPRNFSFFTSRSDTTEERITLVERLRARLGRASVHGLVLVPEHRPELAFREAEPGTSSTYHPEKERPLWLLHVPRPVDPAGLQLLDGPERIESGWWDGNDIRRDYYTALDHKTSRLWVYRETDRRAESEHWFVHGVFA